MFAYAKTLVGTNIQQIISSLQYNNGIRRLLNIQPVTNSYKNTNSLKCNF